MLRSRCFDFLLGWCFDMGAGSSSASSLTEEGKELEELEHRLAFDLPLLKAAFLGKSASNSDELQWHTTVPRAKLQSCFSMEPDRVLGAEADLKLILQHVGVAFVNMVFSPQEEALSWLHFLKGYDGFQQDVKRNGLLLLLTFFRYVACHAQVSLKYEITEKKLEGYMSQDQFRNLLRVCWLLMYYGRFDADKIDLMDVETLVTALFKRFSGGDQAPAEAVYSWMAATTPAIATVLLDYFTTRLQNLVQGRDKAIGIEFSGLLTPARAWVVGLSQRDQAERVLLSAFYSTGQVYLLYRSSLHGKGMNRFWSEVEGYRADALLLFSAQSPDNSSSKCVLAALVEGGLENKSSYYGGGNSCLFALEPELNVLQATGSRERNFIYSYKAAPGAGYTSRSMPNGLGFGGTLGNERVWLDDEFGSMTLRHHAVDKSYQPGSLAPNQGYKPITMQLLEVALWGLGGPAARQQMLAQQKRENLFAEQRRKVDLKAFGNWQDSPEKMMMDMVSDPNRAARQER